MSEPKTTATVACPDCEGRGRTYRTVPGVPASVCTVSSPCDRCWPRYENGERKFWDDGTSGRIPAPSGSSPQEGEQ